jgi:hypothetical protein
MHATSPLEAGRQPLVREANVRNRPIQDVAWKSATALAEPIFRIKTMICDKTFGEEGGLFPAYKQAAAINQDF